MKLNYELPKMKYAEQKGLVSVIVPVHNNEIYLRECLDSILAQTFENWEAILVNDGSTDNTGEIIDEYAKKDSRFIVVHKRNEGTLLARKTGLENSRGEFITNLDHDDIYNPQFLEKMYAKIMETEVDFVWCKCQVTETDKDMRWVYVTDYQWNENVSMNVAIVLTFSQGMSLVTWDKLIKRDIYAKIYFPNEKIIWGEDPIQIIQIVYHSNSAAFVSENLYFHRPAGHSFNTKPISIIWPTVIVYELLEKFFNGKVPPNVENAFKCSFGSMADVYLHLDKKQKREIKNILPRLIKMEKNIKKKIYLCLASIGMEFLFKLIVYVLKKIKHKINILRL